ncbi:MAG: hypothetical protein OXI63_13795 [Candidatus Poribacteria bacterium]|nr:hypothetical protein [Candidatus Poribacteria bacterium]
MKWLVLFFSVFCFMGCQQRQEPPLQIPFRSDIVEHMADVTGDFILTPLHDVFSLKQLAWLQVHRHQLSDAINAEIRGGSTLAIQMAVYLRLETAISVLRKRLLKLQSNYGWEGPDYSTEEAFMSEYQYPYHRIYIWAIQGIAQAPVAAVIKLTDAERDALEEKAAGARPDKSFRDPTADDPLEEKAAGTKPDNTANDDLVDGHAWCAKWLLTQLEPDKKGIE